MVRLTVRRQTPDQSVLQVDGWVVEEEVALLAGEGSRLLAHSRQLVLELGGVVSIDRAGLALLEQWGRLAWPGQAPGSRLVLRDGSPLIRKLLERHGMRCEEGGEARTQPAHPGAGRR